MTEPSCAHSRRLVWTQPSVFRCTDSRTVRCAAPGASELAVGSDEPEYLHGGALATCVDTAAWYAVVYEREGDWVMADLRCDFLRMAVREPHRVSGRCLRAGRTLALCDVQIAPWHRPERTVAVGRAQLARVGG
jgi:acyl-coenzyme A thioesterase PaaI-like protein